jgi:hypothetical protein
LSLSGIAGANKNCVTKSFQLEKGKYYLISVYAMQEGTSASYISIVNREGETQKVLIKEKVNSGIYQKVSVEFFAAEGGVYELGFIGEVSSLSEYLVVDDFEVVPLVVGTPMDLVARNITENSVDLSWKGSADKYEVRIIQSGVEVYNSAVVDNNITVGGLQPAMAYTAQVRAASGTNYSNWIDVTFSTLCGLIYPPYIEDFETSVVSSIPLCWDDTTLTELQDPIYNWSIIKPDEYSFVGDEYGQCAQLKTTTATGFATLLTPQIVVDAEYYLSFIYFNNSETEKLSICVVDNGQIDTILTLGNTMQVWKKERIDISMYKGRTIQIGFKSNLSFSTTTGVVAIDNLRIMCSAEEVEINDAICQPSQGFDTYSKHGFKVLTSELKPGLNVIKEVFEAKNITECDTLKILNYFLTVL